MSELDKVFSELSSKRTQQDKERRERHKVASDFLSEFYEQDIKPSQTLKTRGIEAHFVAPWARGHRLSHRLMEAAEVRALQDGFDMINMDVRETQTGAIKLYETLGYRLWGVHPRYARVEGRYVPGRYYYKDLTGT